jgi:hypothetical protein
VAVSILTTLSQYAGNGSISVPYPTGFPFQDADWLRVWLADAEGNVTLLESGTDYTVTGAGEESGGDVLTTVAYPSTHTLTLARVTPVTQLLDLEYNDRLPAESVEDSLDKITFILQELMGDARRALTYPQAEPLDNDTELPMPKQRRGCVLGFDPANGETVLYELPVLTVPISPPDSGTYVLTSVDGVLQWTGTTNCP